MVSHHADDPVLLLDIYARMHMLRIVEDKLMREYHPANEMRCPIHFCIGQEVLPACLEPLLTHADTLISHYRSHGYYLAKGGDLAAMIAEFYGKAAGANRGVAGSMELASVEDRFHSGAIVGAPLPLALGAAFASKYRDDHSIAVTVFGDGAMDAGVTYEALNLAALKKLPILIICENNGYAAHSPQQERQAGPGLTARAAAFGLDTVIIDGNSPFECSRELKRTIEAIRQGNGPVFLEAKTYRLCGHVGPESDDWLDYRPVAEIKSFRDIDPVTSLRQQLAANSAVTRQIDDFERANERRLETAFAEAKLSAFEDPRLLSELVTNGSFIEVGIKLAEQTSGNFYSGQSEAQLAPY